MGENPSILETFDELKTWLYECKLPSHTNEQALAMWDRALKSPTLINIRCFWVFGGMNRSFPDVRWGAIKEEVDKRVPHDIMDESF